MLGAKARSATLVGEAKGRRGQLPNPPAKLPNASVAAAIRRCQEVGGQYQAGWHLLSTLADSAFGPIAELLIIEALRLHLLSGRNDCLQRFLGLGEAA